ncbi:MAG: O-methyltransferase, partial [Clostridia bacterium]|nr:O-methyltransferase [Clostridia bacterium]
LLKVLIHLHKPVRVLEAGTAIGYSASVMALAMPQNGCIDSMEIEEDMADIAETNIHAMGLSSRIRVLRGDALEIMKCLSTPYDMIFLDASKGQYGEYYSEAMRLLKTGGLLVSDNVLYKGLVTQTGPVEHKHRTIAVKLRDYLNTLCTDERLETSLIPIGDGLAVSVKLR